MNDTDKRRDDSVTDTAPATDGFAEGNIVWASVAVPGVEPSWREATVVEAQADGRYRVHQLVSIGGPQEMIVSPAYLRPHEPGSLPPDDPHPHAPPPPPLPHMAARTLPPERPGLRQRMIPRGRARWAVPGVAFILVALALALTVLRGGDEGK